MSPVFVRHADLGVPYRLVAADAWHFAAVHNLCFWTRYTHGHAVRALGPLRWNRKQDRNETILSSDRNRIIVDEMWQANFHSIWWDRRSSLVSIIIIFLNFNSVIQSQYREDKLQGYVNIRQRFRPTSLPTCSLCIAFEYQIDFVRPDRY